MSTISQFPDFTRFSAVVAGNIRAEAARLGYNQSSLAKALGMTRSQVAERWRGEAEWRLDDLPAVCDVLRVPMKDILRARQDSNLQPSGWESSPFLQVATITDIFSRQSVAS